jgi:hypothetical protein
VATSSSTPPTTPLRSSKNAWATGPKWWGLFIGDPDAPRFVNPGTFPHDPGHRMTLVEVKALGDVAVLRYLAP